MEFHFHKKYRTSVVIALMVMMLTVSRFFWISPLQGLFKGDGSFFTYILVMAVIYIRHMGFEIRFGIAKSMKPLMWILIGVLISFIPAYRYYGQHLYYSIIVYRPFFGYLALPILLSIKPSHLEMKKALYTFSAIYAVVLFYVSFVNPDFIVYNGEGDFIESGEFVHMLEGCQFLPLAFIYALDDLRTKKITVKNTLIAVALFGLLFIIQNRTIILASVILSFHAALSNKSASRRLTTVVLIGLMAIVVGVLVYEYIDVLVAETREELSNPEYNRIKAFNYFVSGENGFMSYIWGNGFISGYVSDIVASLQREGIFHSDLGMIGFWHQFGILAAGTILFIVIRGLSSMRSYVVRANAIYILVGSMTISYFLQFGFSLWLCMYMFLYATDQEYKRAKAISEEKAVRKAIRRYRSLA